MTLGGCPWCGCANGHLSLFGDAAAVVVVVVAYNCAAMPFIIIDHHSLSIFHPIGKRATQSTVEVAMVSSSNPSRKVVSSRRLTHSNAHRRSITIT